MSEAGSFVEQSTGSSPKVHRGGVEAAAAKYRTGLVCPACKRKAGARQIRNWNAPQLLLIAANRLSYNVELGLENPRV